MSLEFYKVLHLFGVFAIILSLGGIGLHAMNGGGWQHPSRALLAAVHGIGLLFALVGGFGMLAKLGHMSSFPGWAAAKLVIWLFMGGVLALFKRKPALAKPMWFMVLVLATMAAWLAVAKPF